MIRLPRRAALVDHAGAERAGFDQVEQDFTVDWRHS